MGGTSMVRMRFAAGGLVRWRCGDGGGGRVQLVLQSLLLVLFKGGALVIELMPTLPTT